MNENDSNETNAQIETLPLFEGMKILFDEKTGLYPVTVTHDEPDVQHAYRSRS